MSGYSGEGIFLTTNREGPFKPQGAEPFLSCMKCELAAVPELEPDHAILCKNGVSGDEILLAAAGQLTALPGRCALRMGNLRFQNMLELPASLLAGTRVTSMYGRVEIEALPLKPPTISLAAIGKNSSCWQTFLNQTSENCPPLQHHRWGLTPQRGACRPSSYSLALLALSGCAGRTSLCTSDIVSLHVAHSSKHQRRALGAIESFKLGTWVRPSPSNSGLTGIYRDPDNYSPLSSR